MRRIIHLLVQVVSLVCIGILGAPASARPPDAAQIMAAPEPEVTLIAVGDLMLARSIGATLARDATASPFAAPAPILQRADITVGNLECALGTSGKRARKTYTFLGPPAAAASLADAGFDVLSLANNHSLDYGTTALDETMRLLDAAGIQHAGAGSDEAAAHRPATLEVRGLRLAFLAYVNTPAEGSFAAATWSARGNRPGVAWAVPKRIAADVAAARQAADLVIVLLHSGYENAQNPSQIQRVAAHAAIDAGAALVIGAHPHVLQGVEYYGSGVIAYSLGNFVFDGLYGRSETAILHVTLGRTGVRAIEWTPVVLRNGRPQPATGRQASAIRRRIERLSAMTLR
ncbi:MAG: CapA family protein [Chloroflexi bacterium]|nr:CapA family protein [Chloroflexota bacterium]